MRWLHLSFHDGCQAEISAVMERLGHAVDTCFASAKEFYPPLTGNERYNMSQSLADAIWLVHKHHFKNYDGIITSDTAPLARIFLRDEWRKPLLVWVCNRFDYSHQPCTHFPDNAWYGMMGRMRENVRIIPYTPFEKEYAEKLDVHSFGDVIRPTGLASSRSDSDDDKLQRDGAVYITPCLSDDFTEETFVQLGINYRRHRYGDPLELRRYRAVVHIPYAMSNFAPFEILGSGVPYLVPSLALREELLNRAWFSHQPISASDWYRNDSLLTELLLYFDSWSDILRILDRIDDAYRRSLVQKMREHADKQLAAWRRVIGDVTGSGVTTGENGKPENGVPA